MRKRVIALILILTISLLQTGCWNSREINELAFVLSIALDKADEGFKVTAQISKAEMYSKTTSGGAGAADKEKPFWVISGTGKTIFEAVRSMASISPRRIFWSHMKIIIISEELAKNNILEIFDFFSRNPELRLRTWIAVTEGEAGKVLEIVPMMEKEPSLNIERIIDKTNLIGNAYSIMLKNFLEEYLDPYIDPVASKLSVITVNSRPTIKLTGACVFGNDNTMAGWLNEDETRGLLWFENKISGSIRVINCPSDGMPVTVEIKKGKTSIKSDISDGVPKFTINVTAKGKITEKGGAADINNTEAISALEDTLAAAIHEDIDAAVKAAQSYDSDFIRFSRTLQRDHKKEWLKVANNWPEVFKNASVDIHVKVDIPEVSLLAKPLNSNQTVSEASPKESAAK